jgi:hypothetical protein
MMVANATGSAHTAAMAVALGEVTTLNGYDALIGIFQDRLAQIGDRAGKLTADHMKKFGPLTLGPILGVLGIKLVAMVDQEQFEKISKRYTPATFRRWGASGAKYAIPARRRPKASYYFSRPGAASSARAVRTARMSPAQRSRAARRAARSRWRAVG